MKTSSLLGILAIAACSPTVKQVSVEPARAQLGAKGAPLQLRAIAKDAKGAPLSVKLTWSTGNPAVASVDATGKAIALESGTAEITAASGAIKGSAEVEVEIPGALSIAPAATTLVGIGQTAQLQLIVKDDAGKVIKDAPATWTSSTASVVAVDRTGAVRSVGAGAATISARIGALTATARVTVTLPPKAKKKARKHRR